MSDIYRDARHADRGLARARMKRGGYAPGGRTAEDEGYDPVNGRTAMTGVNRETDEPTYAPLLPPVTPTERPAHGSEGMNQTETDNYNALKASPKGWSDDEARHMATNPSGRLGISKGGRVKGDKS